MTMQLNLSWSIHAEKYKIATTKALRDHLLKSHRTTPEQQKGYKRILGAFDIIKYNMIVNFMPFFWLTLLAIKKQENLQSFYNSQSHWCLKFSCTERV